MKLVEVEIKLCWMLIEPQPSSRKPRSQHCLLDVLHQAKIAKPRYATSLGHQIGAAPVRA